MLGDGGVGKTALRMAQFLSLASSRALTGEHVFTRCRVLIVPLEDNRDELRRRLRAACIHHNIDQKQLKGWLFLASPGVKGGKILWVDNYGKPIVGKLATKIERVIKERNIDLVCLDPFIKTHSAEENSNSMIDEVVQVLADLAMQYQIGVDLPHHTSKGPADPGNANRGRGASAMKDAARLVYTLTPMSDDEAKNFDLDEKERRLLVRLDSAKVNITPPWHEAKWFKLVGVKLDNANDLYPNGDEVQTVEVWKPPNIFGSMSSLTMIKILNDIDAGLPDGNRYSDAPNATDRAAWRLVAKHCEDKPEATCRRVIKVWVESGLLTKRDYDNPETRKTVTGLWVNHSKRPT